MSCTLLYSNSQLAPLLIDLTPKVAAFGCVLIARYGGLETVS